METKTIEQHEKILREKRTQPIIIEFYNLHLKSGPKYDKSELPLDKFVFQCDQDIPLYENLKEQQVEKKYPDKNEQCRILSFFEKYAPELKADLGGLEWYQRGSGISWFESKYFLRFADDYHYIKQIVDNHIDNKISIINLNWLDSKLYSIKPRLKLIRRQDEKEYKMMPWRDPLQICQEELHRDGFITREREIVDTKDYQIKSVWSRITKVKEHGLGYYGIWLDQLFPLFDQIFIQALAMLEEHWKVSKCFFEGGKRNPPCHNVFISTRNQTYCSKKCYNKARRYRGYLKEQQQ